MTLFFAYLITAAPMDVAAATVGACPDATVIAARLAEVERTDAEVVARVRVRPPASGCLLLAWLGHSGGVLRAVLLDERGVVEAQGPPVERGDDLPPARRMATEVAPPELVDLDGDGVDEILVRRTITIHGYSMSTLTVLVRSGPTFVRAMQLLTRFDDEDVYVEPGHVTRYLARMTLSSAGRETHLVVDGVTEREPLARRDALPNEPRVDGHLVFALVDGRMEMVPMNEHGDDARPHLARKLALTVLFAGLAATHVGVAWAVRNSPTVSEPIDVLGGGLAGTLALAAMWQRLPGGFAAGGELAGLVHPLMVGSFVAGGIATGGLSYLPAGSSSGRVLSAGAGAAISLGSSLSLIWSRPR